MVLPFVRRSAASVRMASVAVLGCALTVAIGCGSVEKRPNSSSASDAGYVWLGKVETVGATWTVPRILSPSRYGVAGTWIGAQTSDEFVQLGTSEQFLGPPRRREYFSFWSDTSHRFHATRLFAVRAGDTVSANLARTRSGWKLAIADSTIHRRRTFSVRSTANASFDQAEWVQEHASSRQLVNSPFDYPRLAPVQFSKVEVNSIVPTYADLFSMWMSVRRGMFAPSPFRDGSFVVRRAALSRFGAQYLRLVHDFSSAIASFAEQESRWTANTPRRRVVVAANAYAVALDMSGRELARDSWPPSARLPIDRLLRLLRTLQRDAAELARAQKPIVQHRHIQTPSAIRSLDHRIRRALRIPEWTS
jgi:hypothetical protein